ncbi:uncharacterized protein [Littorina saxatilis]|uniref:uncharacterized protein n=1 Tax=Littorina saxatilis TaxID=31220 RepID=UPI0038B68692
MSCVHSDIFNVNSPLTNAQGSPVTLNFSISKVCTSEYVRVQTVRVRKKSAFGGHQVVCLFTIEDGTCVSLQSSSCACDPKSRDFSVTTTANHAGDDFSIVAQLKNGETFNETVKIQAIITSTTLTQTSSGPSVLSTEVETQPDVSLQEDMTARDQTEHKDTPDKENLGITQPVLLLVLGAVGFIVLCLLIMAVFLGRLYRRGAIVNLLPAPAPHNVRRAAGNGVRFRVSSVGEPDRESFVSVLGHDYAEIREDVVTASSADNQASISSSPVSDSSMSDDCLHHIACPSSDSSLPEDYLHPVESDVEAPSLPVHKRPASDSSSSSEAVMYSGTTIFCGTPTACKEKPNRPYQNVTNTQ